MPGRTCPPEAAPADPRPPPPRRHTACRPPPLSDTPPSVRAISSPLPREGKSMSRGLPVLCVGLVWAPTARASGFLIPTDSSTPPLAMVSHHVDVRLVEQ